MKLSFSSNFDGDGFKKKMYEAAEKQFKENVHKQLRGAGYSNVKVTFSGSIERNDLKVNLSGPDAEVAEAKRLLAAK